MGLPIQQLEQYAYARVGYTINWTSYRCDTFFDFVQKYAAG